MISDEDEEDDMVLDLMVAPATIADDSLALVWDRPAECAGIAGYDIYRDGARIAHTRPNQTHLTVRGLDADTEYRFVVQAVACAPEPAGPSSASSVLSASASLTARTKPRGDVLDVTKPPYCAGKAAGGASTAAVQRAIDDCATGGTVLIPKGAVVTTGALELKSDMTLRIDGTLKGSLEPNDYIVKDEDRKSFKGLANEDGLVLTRYEGWEMYCYRSLINAGYLNPNNRMEATCENLRICGEGTVFGGGNELGFAMKSRYANKERYPAYVSDGQGGRRARGRLLGFIQCKNMHLDGINIENPPCWAVHMLYCDTVTTHGVNIKSRGVDNGDGWDPDSSRNLMIFDTAFDTGDDCIAIKSGKNPEGNTVNMPTMNVRIFDLKILGGHGMAIGSEQSGGVEGVYIRDCVIRNTLYGLELKAHNDRGGYIKRLRMVDCAIDRFMAHSVSYNSDGDPAPALPCFKDLAIINTSINGPGRAVEIVGFLEKEPRRGEGGYVEGVLFENVVIGNENDEKQEVYLKACRDVVFKNVRLFSGKPPRLVLDEDTVSGLRIENRA